MCAGARARARRSKHTSFSSFNIEKYMGTHTFTQSAQNLCQPRRRHTHYRSKHTTIAYTPQRLAFRGARARNRRTARRAEGPDAALIRRRWAPGRGEFEALRGRRDVRWKNFRRPYTIGCRRTTCMFASLHFDRATFANTRTCLPIEEAPTSQKLK